MSTPTGLNVEEGVSAFHREKLMESGRVLQRLPQHNQLALWVQKLHHSAATDHCWLNVANSSSLWPMVPVPFEEIKCSVGCWAMFEFPTPMIASIMPPTTSTPRPFRLMLTDSQLEDWLQKFQEMKSALAPSSIVVCNEGAAVSTTPAGGSSIYSSPVVIDKLVALSPSHRHSGHPLGGTSVLNSEGRHHPLMLLHLAPGQHMAPATFGMLSAVMKHTLVSDEEDGEAEYDSCRPQPQLPAPDQDGSCWIIVGSERDAGFGAVPLWEASTPSKPWTSRHVVWYPLTSASCALGEASIPLAQREKPSTPANITTRHWVFKSNEMNSSSRATAIRDEGEQGTEHQQQQPMTVMRTDRRGGIQLGATDRSSSASYMMPVKHQQFTKDCCVVNVLGADRSDEQRSHSYHFLDAAPSFTDDDRAQGYDQMCCGEVNDDDHEPFADTTTTTTTTAAVAEAPSTMSRRPPLAPPSPASAMRRGTTTPALRPHEETATNITSSARVIGRFSQALHTAMSGIRSSAARRFLGSSNDSSDYSSDDGEGHDERGNNNNNDGDDSDAGDWSTLNRRRHSAAPCEPFLHPKVSLDISSYSLQQLPPPPPANIAGLSRNSRPPLLQPPLPTTINNHSFSSVVGGGGTGGLDVEDDHSSAVLAALFNDIDSFQRSSNSANMQQPFESSVRRVSGSISKRLLVSPPLSVTRRLMSHHHNTAVASAHELDLPPMSPAASQQHVAPPHQTTTTFAAPAGPQPAATGGVPSGGTAGRVKKGTGVSVRTSVGVRGVSQGGRVRPAAMSNVAQGG
ncbi:Hypothetical protein, putative [Bodo saltans]|uniref:Uncharacterized protein n=1 Tax=Bodo saltans TaxID=75058 RepID=A0A0S4IPR6_BODSA|nr:Hypothetical protein, putative [Bodo saltans]|eukprot:CUF00755.1 Hypothetical protein, putative [Bodo saltans]